jgi:hypothetical protein
MTYRTVSARSLRPVPRPVWTTVRETSLRSTIPPSCAASAATCCVTIPKKRGGRAMKPRDRKAAMANRHTGHTLPPGPRRGKRRDLPEFHDDGRPKKGKSTYEEVPADRHTCRQFTQGFGTSRTRQLREAYTTSEKPARYFRRINPLVNPRLRTDEFFSSEVCQFQTRSDALLFVWSSQ